MDLFNDSKRVLLRVVIAKHKASVARSTSFRLIIALAARLDLELEHIDITTAYLYGDIDHDIFMRQPPGCVIKGQTGKVCKLLKSLYGLKQAGRIWNEVLNDFLQKQGFKCITDGVYIILDSQTENSSSSSSMLTI
jgi:hypothetical protein